MATTAHQTLEFLAYFQHLTVIMALLTFWFTQEFDDLVMTAEAHYSF